MQALKWSLMGLAAAVLFLGSGCTVVVRPSFSESEFLSDAPKAPISVAVYVSDELKNYEHGHFDWWCDARNYDMKVGPMTIDCFHYALESRVQTVQMKPGLPSFPLAEPADFVITPKFTDFKAGGPVAVKFEPYWVEISMEITIQDSQGQVLDTLTLKEKGSKGGSIGMEPGTHIYPETCRTAVRAMVTQTVDKVLELSQNKS